MAGDAVVLMTLRGAGRASAAVIHGQTALAGHELMNSPGWIARGNYCNSAREFQCHAARSGSPPAGRRRRIAPVQDHRHRVADGPERRLDGGHELESKIFPE